MKPHQLKDAILRRLEAANGQSLDDIEDELKKDFYLLFYLSEEMESDGYIKAMRTSGSLRGHPSMIISITAKGRYFLGKGGHIKYFNKNRLNKVWSITKIVCVVIHSILLLYFAYLSVKVQRDNNTIQEKVFISHDCIKTASP